MQARAIEAGAEAVTAATVAWLEAAVIDLDLCPFARGAHAGKRIRYKASVERAVAAHPDIDRIPQQNIETLRSLGQAGWDRLVSNPLGKK